MSITGRIEFRNMLRDAIAEQDGTALGRALFETEAAVEEDVFSDGPMGVVFDIETTLSKETTLREMSEFLDQRGVLMVGSAKEFSDLLEDGLLDIQEEADSICFYQAAADFLLAHISILPGGASEFVRSVECFVLDNVGLEAFDMILDQIEEEI